MFERVMGLGAIGAAGVLACSSSPAGTSGSASVTGTFGGRSFAPKDAVSIVQTTATGSGPTPRLAARTYAKTHPPLKE